MGGLGRPAVVSGLFEPSEILAFSDERGEREFLIRVAPGKCLRCRDIACDPAKYAELHEALVNVPLGRRNRNT